MRILLAALVILLLAFPRPGAASSLEYAWSACPGDGGVGDITLPCDQPGASVTLYASFELTEPLDNLVDIDLQVDLLVDDATLPPFWDFQSVSYPDKCNPGLVLHADPQGACPNSIAPFSSGATAYVGFLSGTDMIRTPNMGRILGSIVADSPTPAINLVAGQRYFAFAIQIFMDAAVEAGGSCAGCGDRVDFLQPRLGWPDYVSNVTLLTSDPSKYLFIQTDQQCLTANGGFGICAPTPTRRSTWGLIKSLYR